MRSNSVNRVYVVIFTILVSFHIKNETVDELKLEVACFAFNNIMKPVVMALMAWRC